ncbi:MAG: PHP domain-containing protein [Candidatus Aenigmarchaeota archaeon]|nr:PHP domain-containing protein [Candidatus Aenigmarchaeota archaeon]
MLAELHCHSIYSTGSTIKAEGFNTLKEIMAHAKKLGIGILALTDHDTIRGHRDAKKYAKKYGIIFIPGEEVTSEKGHILALGIQERIKPGLSVIETIEKIHDQGGIAIAAHPYDFRRKGIGDSAKYCDAIEVFNAINVDRTANLRANKLAELYHKPKTAGSDAHWLPMMGHGLTEIRCTNVDGCLKEIKNGRTKLRTKYLEMSILTEWAIRRLKYSYYYLLNYMDINYRWPKRVIAKRLIKLVNHSPGHIDYIFRGLAYLFLGGIMTYSIFRNIILRR